MKSILFFCSKFLHCIEKVCVIYLEENQEGIQKTMDINQMRQYLYELKDEGYKEFQCKLMPGVAKERVIGVRTPALRILAKELLKSDFPIREFMNQLPHPTYEEDNLHAFMIEAGKDYHETVAALDCFLPYVDNWATCDMMRPKVFRKYRPDLYSKIKEWLNRNDTYTVRFGIGMLMGLYLDEAFLPEHLQLVADVQSEEYYIKMMVAWYFATALAKQYDKTIIYIEEKRLEPWTHNKAIQKAIESYRITKEQKIYLRTLKTGR